VAERGQRRVASTRLALRGPDETLGVEEAKRFPHGRATDPELTGELGLGREPTALRQRARDDQLAQLVGDLLVALSHPAERDARGPSGIERLVRRARSPFAPAAHVISNSAFPATETGVVDGGSTPAK